MNFFLRVNIMIRNIILLILFISLYSCQSIKDGLTGKKYESSDEFLVIKKNPLVLPPDFKMLPEPKEQVKISRQETIELEIDEVLSSLKSEDTSAGENASSSGSSSTEDFVIDQIKN
tara:strand:+ start:3083 stop:3433 length:351 start_codon:yes stop_codon:yes gene_type:complete